LSKKNGWGESKAKVIEAHARGLTVRQTAEVYGLTTTTVRCLVRRLGVSMKMQPRGVYDKATKKYAILPTFPENSLERGK